MRQIGKAGCERSAAPRGLVQEVNGGSPALPCPVVIALTIRVVECIGRVGHAFGKERDASVFDTYRFDKPDSDRAVVLDRWAWLWAAIAGPVYVLLLGFVKPALLTLVVSISVFLAAAISLAFIVGFIDSLFLSLVAIVVIPVAAMLTQASAAMQLIRRHLLHRGWRAGH